MNNERMHTDMTDDDKLPNETTIRAIQESRKLLHALGRLNELVDKDSSVSPITPDQPPTDKPTDLNDQNA